MIVCKGLQLPLKARWSTSCEERSRFFRLHSSSAVSLHSSR